MPAIGRVLAWRRLRRIDYAQGAGAELHDARRAFGFDVLEGGEQVLHRLGADAPFQGAVNVRIEFGGGKFRRLVQSEMQAEQRPTGVLKAIELCGEGRGQLRASDQIFESLMHVYG